MKVYAFTVQEEAKAHETGAEKMEYEWTEKRRLLRCKTCIATDTRNKNLYFFMPEISKGLTGVKTSKQEYSERVTSWKPGTRMFRNVSSRKSVRSSWLVVHPTS
jgi:hypothetical protein